MRIIPAIDIIDGKCVRLSKGDYNTKKVYNSSPLDTAKAFEDSGIEYLHVVDLDGAKAGRVVNYRTLESICVKTNLKVDFGGGLKSNEDLRIAFESGANQITGGSIAVREPATFKARIEQYGSEKIILGADCKDRKIAIAAWSETAELDVLDFIKQYEQEKIDYVICTDISKDGMLEGPSFELYQEIIAATDVKLIASGGVSKVDDLLKLKALGCEGAIVGKAFYEGRITLRNCLDLFLSGEL